MKKVNKCCKKCGRAARAPAITMSAGSRLAIQAVTDIFSTTAPQETAATGGKSEILMLR